jgi:hypothetical protein
VQHIAYLKLSVLNGHLSYGHQFSIPWVNASSSSLGFGSQLRIGEETAVRGVDLGFPV